MNIASASAAATTRRRSAHPGVKRKLRQQGGTTVLSIPSGLLAELGLAAGAEVEVRVIDGKLVAEPKFVPLPRRRRYTLAELLQGAENLPQMYAGTEGALAGPAVGQEMG